MFASRARNHRRIDWYGGGQLYRTALGLYCRKRHAILNCCNKGGMQALHLVHYFKSTDLQLYVT